MSTASKIENTEGQGPVRQESGAGAGGGLVPNRFDILCKRVFRFERMMLDWSVWLVSSKEWALLDWSTLTEISPDHVSERNVNRRSDLVWCVRATDGKSRYYFLFEFQSRVQRGMALRMNEGVAMLMAQASADGRDVPMVQPVVVYTGPGRWRAPQSLDGIYPDGLPGLRNWRARLRYRVVELLHYRGRGLRGKGNFASSLFRALATESVDDLERELLAMLPMVTDEITRKLGAAIAELCLVLLEMRGLPELAERLAHGKITLEGVTKKMQEINWRQPILEKGREQGLEQGLEKGLEQGLEKGLEKGCEKGRKELLAKLAEARFGKKNARTLSKLLRSVESVGRLDQVGLWLVECDSFDTLRARLEIA